MEQNGTYKWLGSKRGSLYHQYFVKDRGIRALTLYKATLEPDAMTPEEVAADWDVPVEAVLESIEYCKNNQHVLQRDWDEEEESIRAQGLDKPPPEALRSRQAS
jgi:hypothetical protein